MMVHDVIIQKINREKNLLNTILFPLLRKTEYIFLHNAHKIFCFSNKDKQLLKNLYDVNAVKVDFYLNVQQPFLEDNQMQIQNKFVLFAAWNRKENADGLEWFLKNFYPNVNKDVWFEIIGAGATKELKEKLNKEKRIKYTGFVADPFEKFLQSKALIAPLFKGAGVKVKVLEALAAGTSVIGTDVAFEGIEVPVLNDRMFCCPNAGEFIRAIDTHTDVTIHQKIIAMGYFKCAYPKEKLIKYL
jgi:glycosyltransferase involved in cell wall biosynthesis